MLRHSRSSYLYSLEGVPLAGICSGCNTASKLEHSPAVCVELRLKILLPSAAKSSPTHAHADLRMVVSLRERIRMASHSTRQQQVPASFAVTPNDT